MIFPQNNLPAQSQQWRRAIEKGISALATASSNLNTAVAGSNARLSAIFKSQTDLQAQTEFLINQNTFAESTPPSFTGYTTNPIAANLPWYQAPFSSTWDIEIPLRTSSTGRIAFSLGCYLFLSARDGATALGSVGLQILDSTGAAEVRYARTGDGNLSLLKGPDSGQINFQNAMSGHTHFLSLPPNTDYIFRTRRMYTARPGVGASPQASTQWQGSSLQVTKIGM